MFGFENSSWNQDLRESFGIALFQGRAGPNPNQSGFSESRKSFFFRAKSLLLLRGIVKMLLLCEIAEVFLLLREIAKVLLLLRGISKVLLPLRGIAKVLLLLR